MGKTHTFPAEIKEAAFGSKRPKVWALIEGVPYRGSLVRMGSDCHMLGILKDIREQTGKSFGDTIRLTFEEDTAPRRVEVPPAFAAALRKEKAAQAYFNSLSCSHQREYVGYITEAKREETRTKRIEKTVELLKQGGSKNRSG